MKYLTGTTEDSVLFKNPRRPVRQWCNGYLHTGQRVRRGITQRLVFMPCGTRHSAHGYFVWVDEKEILLEK